MTIFDKHGFQNQIPGFEFQLIYIWAVWHWISYLTFLCLSFPRSNIKITIVSPWWGCCKSKWVTWKVFATVHSTLLYMEFDYWLATRNTMERERDPIGKNAVSLDTISIAFATPSGHTYSHTDCVGVYKSFQFWHHLPGISLRSLTLRAQVPQNCR